MNERGDWRKKVKEARERNQRLLKIKVDQISASRSIGIPCPELEKEAVEHVEALKRIDDIENKFKVFEN